MMLRFLFTGQFDNLRKRWSFFFYLFKKDPDSVIKRCIFRLKFSNLFLQFKILRFKCSNIILNFRLTRVKLLFQRRHGARFFVSLRYARNVFLTALRACH
jgi:hypothetical protein